MKSDSTSVTDYVAQDLFSIGYAKPMGYLPLETINRCGYDIDQLEKELQKRHLQTVRYADGKSMLSSGALVAYSHDHLQNMLNRFSNLLTNSNWPSTVKEFVDNVCCDWTVSSIAQPNLYKLIGMAFGDSRFVSNSAEGGA